MKFYEDEVYIKMCSKAKEIQYPENEIVLYPSEFFAFKGAQKGMDYGTMLNYNPQDRRMSNIIWLPRQDQLQEMILDKYSFLVKLTAYVDFIKYNETYPKLNFDTHEKWWLAFVMKEKFNKTWNGEDWI